jgi:hypothetical protein
MFQFLNVRPFSGVCETATDGRSLVFRYSADPTPRRLPNWIDKLFSYFGTEMKRDFSLDLWDIAAGVKTTLLACDDDYALSADGKLLALRPDNQTIQIWDLPPRKPRGWFLGLAGLLLMLTLGGFWWQARRRKRQAALATEAIQCGTC